MSSIDALTVCALLASIGTALDACELIAMRAQNEKVFRWDVLTTLNSHGLSGKTTARLCARGLTTLVQVPRLFCALSVAPALWIAPDSALGPALACASAILQLLTQNRLVFGLDGADQMLAIVWSGIAISAVSPLAGITLITGQALLAYFAAGVAKLFGREWRTGVAAERIVRTAAHGSARAAALLSFKPIGRAATWGTMVFELLAPGAILFGSAGAVLFVSSAAIFHASIAWSMGLNNFFWAFAAALPAIYWCATENFF